MHGSEELARTHNSLMVGDGSGVVGEGRGSMLNPAG